MSCNSRANNPGYRMLKQVVDGGCCIGCGLCSYVLEDDEMAVLNEEGMFQPNLEKMSSDGSSAWDLAEMVCPFSDSGPDENQIAQKLFPNLPRDERIGRFSSLYVGRITDETRLNMATSGGVITWVLCRLLAEGLVDYVVHVKPTDAGGGTLFSYGISRSAEEVVQGGKSRYYPVELSGVLREIESESGVCVIVALPCFLKGLRRLSESRPSLGGKMKYFVGLVCGHLKSAAFAECFSWQMGVSPGHADAVDFRVKFSDGSAGDYGFSVTQEGRTSTRRVRGLLGGDWGTNLFRYPACDFCDDVFAECADLVVGDAWLPKYMEDPRGHSVIVTRDAVLEGLLITGQEEGSVLLDKVSLEEVAASQAGGLRDRREGLSYRLHLREKSGDWAPRKRVAAEPRPCSRTRRGIYRSRKRIADASHKAWIRAVALGDYSNFSHEIGRMLKSHYDWYKPGWKRPLAKVYRWLKRILFRAR